MWHCLAGGGAWTWRCEEAWEGDPRNIGGRTVVWEAAWPPPRTVLTLAESCYPPLMLDASSWRKTTAPLCCISGKACWAVKSKVALPTIPPCLYGVALTGWERGSWVGELGNRTKEWSGRWLAWSSLSASQEPSKGRRVDCSDCRRQSLCWLL